MKQPLEWKDGSNRYREILTQLSPAPSAATAVDWQGFLHTRGRTRPPAISRLALRLGDPIDLQKRPQDRVERDDRPGLEIDAQDILSNLGREIAGRFSTFEDSGRISPTELQRQIVAPKTRMRSRRARIQGIAATFDLLRGSV